MEFEWDKGKSDACYLERGFDFSYVIAAFFDNNRLIRHDKRWDYGEERHQLLGKVEGRLFFCELYPQKKSDSNNLRQKGKQQRDPRL